MKLRMLTLFSFLLAGFTTIMAQQFEGIITMTVKGEQELSMDFTVKDDLVLMEVDDEGQKVKVISEKETGDMTTLLEKDGKKMAIKMGREMMNQGMNSMDFGEVDDNAKVNITGETKMINGYKCTKITGKNDRAEAIAWVTKDLNFSLFDLVPMAKDAAAKTGAANMQEKMMEEGFVMEYWEKELSSGDETTMSTTVKEQTIDPKVFQYSKEEYTFFDMTDLMQMMQDAQNDPEKMKQLQELMQEFGN